MISLAIVGIGSSEIAVLLFVISVVGSFAVWRFVHLLLDGHPAGEPWDHQTAAALAQEDARPLCCRCLQPHEEDVDFCPECGAPVGTYTNLLPFTYLFSVGDVLRVGTSGAFHRTPLTVVGFFLLGLAEYTILAPFYWFMFFRNLGRQQHEASPPNTVGAE